MLNRKKNTFDLKTFSTHVNSNAHTNVLFLYFFSRLIVITDLKERTHAYNSI